MKIAPERLLLFATPVVAMTAVGLGLRLGAKSSGPSALVFAFPPADGQAGLNLQVVALDGDARSTLAHENLDVVARRRTALAEWRGMTNDDGVAEAHLALEDGDGAVELEVRSGDAILARGETLRAPTFASSRAPPFAVWMPFARRTGDIVLDVAVLGQRVAPGFAAELGVRATGLTSKPTSGDPLSGVHITPDDDSSVSAARVLGETDESGWTQLRVTPVGLSVGLHLRAARADGRSGEWDGGLYVSPGAPAIDALERYRPGEVARFALLIPSMRKTMYAEIDSQHGRAWATALSLSDDVETSPGVVEAHVDGPRLNPGFYWIIASADRDGATNLGPGSAVRPFVVAEDDDAAFAHGPDDAACPGPQGARTRERLFPCLVTASVPPLPRWLALDGRAMNRKRDEEQRRRGLAVAIGALGVASLLVVVLLLRTALTSGARLGEQMGLSPSNALRGLLSALGLATALLVALLGFGLLAAFVVRAG